MNCLFYIIAGAIFVISLVLLILDEESPNFYMPDWVGELVKGALMVDLICILILAMFSIELLPYVVHKDNIKNVNQYESVMYELKHPEDFREIDRIHDARDWNDKYDRYIYSHDNNIFFGVLYPLGDMEGTEHIDIEKYLGE